MRYNSELYKLLQDMDVVECINIQWMRWLGYVVRMVEDAPARRGSAKVGKEDDLCIRWKDQTEEPCHRLI